MRHEMNRIQSKGHNIESYRINNFFLSSYYDKKYVLADEYSRLSHFHKPTRFHHIKINFVEYRQFVLIFTRVRTIILFSSLSVLQQVH